MGSDTRTLEQLADSAYTNAVHYGMDARHYESRQGSKDALAELVRRVSAAESTLSAYREAVAEVLAAFETTYYIRDEQPPHPDDRAELRRRAAMKNLKAALDAAK